MMYIFFNKDPVTQLKVMTKRIILTKTVFHIVQLTLPPHIKYKP